MCATYYIGKEVCIFSRLSNPDRAVSVVLCAVAAGFGDLGAAVRMEFPPALA